MRYSRLAIWPALVLTFLLFPLDRAGAAERDIWDFEPRTNVKMSVLLIEPEEPEAVIVWMQGGNGKENFNVKGIPDMIAGFGFTVAAIDAPSDQKGYRGGIHPNFRITSDHLEDMDAVVSWLKEKTKLPIWLVGISMGSVSVVNYAINGGYGVDGLVLLSSIIVPAKNKKFPSVNKLPVQKITIPLFAVAHRKDGCKVSPANGAKMIVNAAKASAMARALMVSGGKSRSTGCAPGSHHTFAGIQIQVASAIADFIKANGK